MKRRFWTIDEDSYIIQHYANQPTIDVAKHLGRELGQVYHRAQYLGVNKSHEFLSSAASGRLMSGDHRGRLNQFRKGMEPKNKGKKIEEYMSSAGIEASKKTRFKKGGLPHNTLEDGIITTRKDKYGKPQKFIRLALGKWLHLKNYVWQEAKGEIPKGMCVRFKDGNSLNVELDNLELIDRRKNMELNSIKRYPAELRDLMRLNGRVKSKLNKL
jgi:hypothetical protein